MSIPVNKDTVRRYTRAIRKELGNQIKKPRSVLIGNPFTQEIYADEEKTRVYVHSQGNDPDSVTTVASAGIRPKDLILGRPYKIAQDDNEDWYFLRVDAQGDKIFSAGLSTEHEQTPVKLSQLDYGTLHPQTGLILLVKSAVYDNNYVADLLTADFSTGTVQDTSSSNITIPTTNNRAKGVLIQIDPVTSTLSYKQSSEFIATISLAQAYGNSLLPSPDSSKYRIGYFKLIKGITQFDYSHLWILPEFLSKGINGSTGATDNAIIRADGTGGITIQASGVTIDDNDRIVIPDNASVGRLNITPRSVAPTAPNTDDIYLDDGTNRADGLVGYRQWNSASWDDLVDTSGITGMTSFSLAADTGTPESIADGNTLTVTGGTGIDTSVAATDTVTIAIDSTVTTLTGSQTLTNKTLTTPTIADLTNATHTHLNNAGGGTLSASAIASGTLAHERGGLEADVSAYAGVPLISGGATSEIKYNLAATAAPTTGDDSGDGYVVGSIWIDTTNDKAYVCLDNTLAAAVWTETTQGGGSSAPVDATYIVQTANGTLTNEQALGALATGIVKNTTTTGVLSIATQGTDYYAPGGTDVSVADGGTGLSSATAYAVLCGGTTGTGAFQSIAGVGTSGQVLTSNGAGALPTFQAAGSAFVADGITWTDPTSQTWTALNQGSGTYTEDTTNKRLVMFEDGNATRQVRGWYFTAPSTPYIATFYIQQQVHQATGNGAGVFHRASDGKLRTFGYRSGTSRLEVTVSNWNSATSVNANILTGLAFLTTSRWWQVEDDGVDTFYRISPDGIIWQQIYTIGNTTFLTPIQLGFGMDLLTASTYDASASLLSVELA